MNNTIHLQRRRAWPVRVGEVTIGGDAPVVVQSMTTTSTNDTSGSASQIKRIADAGGSIVRLTTQGVREAENLTPIKEALSELGVSVPLVADVHFNPRAAFAAATRVEKVRINPGNFVDPGRTFKKIEFTDEEYAAELGKIRDALVPLIELCKQHHTALRIGVNHGSLSDRIMSRYGDTPAGMVESAMEFLRVCLSEDFRDVVISIKASSVLVMTETVRRLVKAMDAEDMHFPLHLGVTEAGDGEDGRIKSAVGIGSLLMDGIGDTIRVSLSEEPECEIPVARAIISHVDDAVGEAEGFEVCS
ncbi:MAG: (E)-4-hydroxy-3-methylbut-2-enyl-diphosphate synthase [Duncaniella sp.]|nr:(E)-4-hydroxy-3-methylbut-2-enyl-diphosphate synthase [Duncaniella sp.]